jgi:hypothetical protein
MEIYLDGARQMTLQARVPTVGAALVELNAWLQQNGRALQRVSIDGKDVPAEALTREFGDLPAAQVARLDVTSARVLDLVGEALDEVENVLPEMSVACQTLAQIISGEEPEAGLEPLAQLLEVWTALRDRRRQIAGALKLELGALEVSGQALSVRELELDDVLGRVTAARAKKDYKALADLLAYNVFELAEQEIEVFALLRGRCAESV